MILTLLLSCAPAPDTAQPWPDEPPTTLTSLEDGRLLRRLSLDLRGVLPSLEELDAVAADPEALDTLRDDWLEDPRLEERLVQLLAEQWHTRIEEYLLPHDEYRVYVDRPDLEYAFERAVGEEPLRLMARIAADDRPWTEVVLSDSTMAHPLTLAVWPTEALEESEGWVEARYTDGRPAAGVLSTNGLWWRYYSTVSNLNRGRAAAVARLLLCEDLLSRPISFAEGPALIDADGVEEALRSNPYCQGCHSAVDPLAASLFGFWAANEYNIHEIDSYHLEREHLGEDLLGVSPAYFGEPVTGLADLGQQIAEDPRFTRCAVERSAEALWRRPVEAEDFDRVERLRLGFLEEGLRLKPLLAAITDTPEYRAGGHEGSTPEALSREATARLMTPELLGSAFEELSGFTWTWQGYEQLGNDLIGFRALAGGVDGEYVTRPQSTPSFTQLLVVERLSEAAARHIVERDLGGGAPELLTRVDLDTSPEDEAFQQQLVDLHRRLYGLSPEASRLEAATALWVAVEASSDPSEAWVVLLSALLRDPEMVIY
ncbi:MAG: DUF1585 domain-containing protein [Alphaproteobacteria bacterium]|nr:DUF1585 domain-containing protein [Alphaproteobacteria bacterium]